MIFPVIFHPFGFTLHAHQVMEAAAYFVGSQLYWALGRLQGPKLKTEQTLWIIVGCLVGALVGSKVLALIESIHHYWAVLGDPRMFGGKTIAGGLVGGWIGVEIAKRQMGITRASGDRFVFPILIGLAIGRIGCFLEGLPDHTYGIATHLPWGVNFGDGIHRHPTQLYESCFCLLLAGAILFRMRKPWREGELFRLMMLGYFCWRFAVEFIKPRETYFGLSPIQMTCGAGAIFCLWSLYRIRTNPQQKGDEGGEQARWLNGTPVGLA